MKKWTKRISIGGGVMILLLGTAGLIGWWLFQGTPDWYRPGAMNATDRAAAAQRAINKLVSVQNQAAFARGSEQAARNGAPATTRYSDAITISLSDEELNAIFQEWSILDNAKSSYEQFIQDPYVVLKDGRLILAGRFKELNSVMSLHFEPRINESGQLDMKLARVLAGKLPLPESMLERIEQNATESLGEHLPDWREKAAIDQTGIANSSAISAATGQQLINILKHEPAEPVLFMRLARPGSVPVRLNEIKIIDNTIQLTVQPMTPPQRESLLANIRNGTTVASGGE